MNVVLLYLLHSGFCFLGNRYGAAHSRLLQTSCAERPEFYQLVGSEDDLKSDICGMAGGRVFRSVVGIAVRRGKLFGPCYVTSSVLRLRILATTF